MLTDRFMCYLTGGTASGSTKNNPGARDTSAPRGSAMLLLDGAVFYATESTVWGGGGCAFLDPATPGIAVARGWLITTEQFTDVCTQECGLDPRLAPCPVDIDAILTNGSHTGPGLYGRGLLAGVLDGVPVVTFTSPFGADVARLGVAESTPTGWVQAGMQAPGARSFVLNPPGERYAGVIRAGIAEMVHEGLPVAHIRSSEYSVAL
jgi:hypothetical protein